ncbi:MAG TPA: hypothetical protein VHX14_16655, partial [Thermoanaerobaculia bacterium]|nr:hypothetical protein [Thermoanaerobaculia bacterium]
MTTLIRTAARVIRGEGPGSAFRRAAERIGESLRLQTRLVRGALSRTGRAPLLNVLATPPSPRLGGLQIQLLARLREEQAFRGVALLHPGVLEVGTRTWRLPRAPLGSAIADALARTGARVAVRGQRREPRADVVALREAPVVAVERASDK